MQIAVQNMLNDIRCVMFNSENTRNAESNLISKFDISINIQPSITDKINARSLANNQLSKYSSLIDNRNAYLDHLNSR